MSLLSKLFGGGGGHSPEPEIYKGFRILAEPIKEPGGFRIAARIELDADGETRTHKLIRADVCNSEDQAREISTLKAKALIDEQGEGLFG